MFGILKLHFKFLYVLTLTIDDIKIIQIRGIRREINKIVLNLLYPNGLLIADRSNLNGEGVGVDEINPIARQFDHAPAPAPAHVDAILWTFKTGVLQFHSLL